MKRRLQYVALCALSFFSVAATAQSYTETFDNFANLGTNGWVFNNLSTPVGSNPGWGDGSVGAVFPGFSNNYVYANFNNVAGAADISNWMISPVTNLTNGSTFTFYTRTVDAPAYADRLEVRISTNGASTNVGATNASVGDFSTLLLTVNPTLTTTGYPSTWTQYTVTINGLGAPTSGRIAFRYYVTNGGPAGANSDYIGVDEFSYTDITAGGSANLTVQSTLQQYTNIPLPQATNINLGGTIRNTTGISATDAQLSVNVYQAPNFTTPVFTQASPAAALAGNTTSPTINIGTYTPTSAGQYRFQYISTCTGNTVTSADTMNYDVEITNGLYARDNGIVAGGIGIGAGPVGYLGNKFKITTSAGIDSVFTVLNKTGLSLGDSTRISIYSFSAGLPSTLIGTSSAYTFTANDTLPGLDTLIFQITDLAGNRLVLTPGDYLVALNEYNENIEIANTASIFNPNTVYVNWATIPTGTWTAVEAFGANFAKTLMIRPYLGDSCVVTTATDVQVACGSYTWIDGNLYTASNNTAMFTLMSSTGCDSIITLDLTITTILTSTDTQTACDSYTWVDGNTYIANNNTAQVTLVSTNGCDSIVTLNLTINTTPVSSAVDNGNNTITATGGTTYQWINCTTNLPVAGANSATFAPTANGSYAAIVSNGTACADTTNCITISTIGLNENNTLFAELFPNPTTNKVTVRFDGNVAQVTVKDVQGKQVFTTSILNNEVISLSKVQSGIYFFTIETEKGNTVIRVVKE